MSKLDQFKTLPLLCRQSLLFLYGFNPINELKFPSTSRTCQLAVHVNVIVFKLKGLGHVLSVWRVFFVEEPK